jgi:hypothetical protein
MAVATLLSQTDRELILAITRDVNDARLLALGSTRTYRNILVVATLVLALGAFVLPIVAIYFNPDLLRLTAAAQAIPVVTTSQDATTVPALPPIGTIEAWGAVGGLIGGLAAIWSFQGNTDPPGLQIAQIALKLPAGAWTGLVGIIILQSTLVPSIKAATMGSLAAYAIIFGAGQQALTRFVDNRAEDLLAKRKGTTT